MTGTRSLLCSALQVCCFICSFNITLHLGTIYIWADGKRGADPVATAAEKDGVTVHKFKKYRGKVKEGGKVLPDVMKGTLFNLQW